MASKAEKLGLAIGEIVDAEFKKWGILTSHRKSKDAILQVFHDAGGVMLADGKGLPPPSTSHTDDFLLGYQTGQGVMVNGGYRLVEPLNEDWGCEQCDKVAEDPTPRPCPYCSEINGDETPRILCNECCKQNAMDV